MIRLAVVSLLLVGVAVVGCRQEPPAVQRSAGPPRVLHQHELTEAEKRYGHSPEPAAAVTYQPDVVMLPAGADAIRAVSADGLVWTLDPHARDVEQVQPGKVLVLTSRAAGRVLGIQRANAGVQVVLGPVEITEVVQDGQFTFDQAVDFDQALSFPAPDVFDPAIALDPLTASAARRPGLFPALGTPCPPPFRPIAPFVEAAARTDCPADGTAVGFAALGQTTVHRFTLTPLVGARGVGVRIASDTGGVHFLGEAVVYLDKPRLRFDLDIRGGKVVLCEVQLHGAAGLLLTFESASPGPMAANINERRYLPVDFSLPVSGLGVPFAVTVRQIFQLQTAFTSSGPLRARLYYTLRGGLRAGYRDGRWSMGGPAGVTPQEDVDSFLSSMQGATIGVTGMVMTHQMNVMVGIGAFGFLTGPYGFLNSSVAVARGSGIGILQGPLTCRQATLSMGVGAGVGYQVPEPVAGAINAVLRTLNIQEKLQSAGGFQTKPANIVNISRYRPSIQACR